MGTTDLFAYATTAFDWTGALAGQTGRAGLAPTFYSIGIVVCCALLVFWWGMVRGRR